MPTEDPPPVPQEALSHALGPARGRMARDIALLALVATVTLLCGLNRSPAHRIQELRVLEVAREMWESGDLIRPRFCGEPRYRKPPLAYWLALGGYAVAGRVSEAAGRAYSAIAGFLAACVLYALGHSAGRPRMGLWAGIVLLTSFLAIRSSRLAETDMLLGALTAASLYAFWRAFEPGSGSPRSGWIVLGWVWMAAGSMSKSLAGLSYPLVAMGIFLVAFRRWRDLRALFHPLGVVAFLILFGLWPFVLILLDPNAVDVFLLEIDVTATGQGHGKHLWYSLVYYFVQIWRDFAPWCIFLIPAVLAAFARSGAGGKAGRRAGAFPLLALLLAWAGSVLLQLQLVGNKQAHYLVPALPALAGLVAWWLDEGAPGISSLRPPRPARIVTALAGVTMVLTAVLVSLGLGDAGNDSRGFAKRVRETVGGARVYCLAASDPEMCFHLGRVVPGLQAHEDPRPLQALLARGEPFFLLSHAKDKAAAERETSLIASFPELRLVFRSESGEPRRSLYRFPGTESGAEP